MQEVLIAIHAKRHTWDETARSCPGLARWCATRRLMPCDVSPASAGVTSTRLSRTGAELGQDRDRVFIDAERALAALSGREAGVVRAIALEGASAREAAARLGLNEGAVRVALHRGLRRLATLAGMRADARARR